MPFVLLGPRSQVVIDDLHQTLFSTLPGELGVTAPQLDRIWDAFYADPQLDSPAEVQQLRDELRAVRAAYEQRRRRELVHAKRIEAKDAGVLDGLLAPMLAADPLLAKLDELERLCNEAIDAGRGLRCESD